MFKRLAIVCFLATVIISVMLDDAFARTKNSKSKRKSTHSKTYKPSKHSRKSRRFSRHHGNGPDLKAMTTESPYKEDPSNGVTPIETKQPRL